MLNLTAAYIDVVRNTEFSEILECMIDDPSLPDPVPLPTRSWFKDGQLVSTTRDGEDADISTSSLAAQNPILMTSFSFIFISRDGSLILNNGINNISNPMLGNLLPNATVEQAMELLIDIFLGNWTCLVNNSLGSSLVEYILRRTGKCI